MVEEDLYLEGIGYVTAVLLPNCLTWHLAESDDEVVSSARQFNGCGCMIGHSLALKLVRLSLRQSYLLTLEAELILFMKFREFAPDPKLSVCHLGQVGNFCWGRRDTEKTLGQVPISEVYSSEMCELGCPKSTGLCGGILSAPVPQVS